MRTQVSSAELVPFQALCHFKLNECLLQSLDVLNSEKISIFLGYSVLVEILAFVSLRFNKKYCDILTSFLSIRSSVSPVPDLVRKRKGCYPVAVISCCNKCLCKNKICHSLCLFVHAVMYEASSFMSKTV